MESVHQLHATYKRDQSSIDDVKRCRPGTGRAARVSGTDEGGST
jgi:hypothetical protein